METIYKYTLKPETTLELPIDAQPLSIGQQGKDLVMWVRLDPDSSARIDRTFLTYGTGHEMTSDVQRYIGTVQCSGTLAGLVFHVFELLRAYASIKES